MGPAQGTRLPFVAIATTTRGLIPHCFDLRYPHNSVNCLCSAALLMQPTTSKKISGEPVDPHYSIWQGEISSKSKKERRNGLESTENRRSVGRHGNQHVYVRDPQVSGRLSITFSFCAGGLPGVTRSRAWGRVVRRGPPRVVVASRSLHRETDHASRRRPGRWGGRWRSAMELRMPGMPEGQRRRP
jgi:hypothetical protein